MSPLLLLASALARRTPRFRGRDRALRWVFLKGAKDNTFVVECEGAKFRISGSDLNEFYLAINGIHSPAIHKAICCFIDATTSP